MASSEVRGRPGRSRPPSAHPSRSNNPQKKYAAEGGRRRSGYALAPLPTPGKSLILGAGIMLSCAFFILGLLLAPYTGIPGPILMIICAVIMKVSCVMPVEMEQGAYQINRFMATSLTFAILVAMGTMLVSWR